MKLLLDQGLPRSTVAHLKDMGTVAEHVGNIGMATAADADILEKARTLQAIVVTLDSDFHSILAASQATSPSVIRIRIEGLKGEQLAAILQCVMGAAGTELDDGAAVSVTPDRIRVRRLPIVA